MPVRIWPISLSLVLLLFTTFFTGNAARVGIIQGNEYLLNVSIVLFFVILTLTVLWNKPLTLNTIDIVFGVFFIYVFIRSLISHPYWTDSFASYWLSLLSFVIFRVFFSNQPSSLPLLWVLIAYISIHVAIGFHQLYNKIVIPGSYSLAGVFVGSGPFAVFLVAFLPLCLMIIQSPIKELKNSRVSVWFALITSAILILVFFTFSRTSWISGVLSIALTYILLKKKDSPKKIINRLATGATVFLFAAILLGALLFNIKRDSAIGRVLVWKVCLSIIQEHPLVGVGFNGFKKEYIKYQSDYFSAETRPLAETRGADQVQFAFNSFLSFTIENGLIGLAMLMILLVVVAGEVIKMPRDNIKNDFILLGAVGCFASILFSSVTSYSFETLPIKVIFFASLGIISSRLTRGSLTVPVTKNIMIGSSLLLFSVVFIFSASSGYAKKQWKNARVLVDKKEYVSAEKIFSKSETALKYEPNFLLDYSNLLYLKGDYPASIQKLQSVSKLLSDTIVYGYFYKNYYQLKNFDSAELMIKKRIYSVPNQFRPRYKLVNLYLVSGDTLKAFEQAKFITEMDVKVKSSVVDTIQSHMKQLILIKSK
jgi:O-antigen polymerase